MNNEKKNLWDGSGLTVPAQSPNQEHGQQPNEQLKRLEQPNHQIDLPKPPVHQENSNKYTNGFYIRSRPYKVNYKKGS